MADQTVSCHYCMFSRMLERTEKKIEMWEKERIRGIVNGLKLRADTIRADLAVLGACSCSGPVPKEFAPRFDMNRAERRERQSEVFVIKNALGRFFSEFSTWDLNMQAVKAFKTGKEALDFISKNDMDEQSRVLAVPKTAVDNARDIR